MNEEPISQQEFLLSELRYSIGQLHVQLGNLHPDSLGDAPPGKPSINDILDALITRERNSQSEYARLLKLPTPIEPEPAGDREAVFDALRDQTIALLQQGPAAWGQELIDAVQEQVRSDRQSATEIAERRDILAAEANNPNIQRPLTEPTS